MKDTVIDRNLFSKYFNKEFRIYKILGLNFNKEIIKYPKMYKMYAVCISFGFIVLFNFLQILTLLTEPEDPFERALAIFCLTALLASLKLGILYKRKGVISDLLSQVSDPLFLPKNQNQLQSVNRSLKFQSHIRNVLTYLTQITLVYTYCRPLLTTKNLMPLELWYPFDQFQSPFYAICYTHQIISMYFVAIMIINTEILLGAIMNFIGLQCDLLCYKVKYANDSNLKYEIRQCISLHKKILK